MRNTCKHQQVAVMVLSLIVAASEASKRQVEHLQVDDSHLIDTSSSNFALTAPELALHRGWKTVSVNGNNVVIVSPSCEKSIKKLTSLSTQEQTILRHAKEQLYREGRETEEHVPSVADQPRLHRSASLKYSSDGKLESTLFASNIEPNSFERNGAKITKLGDSDISIGRRDFPKKIAMIFVDDDVATFVHTDGRVKMKPISCSNPLEAQLIEQIEAEVEYAEPQRKSKLSMDTHNRLQNLILNVLDGQ